MKLLDILFSPATSPWRGMPGQRPRDAGWKFALLVVLGLGGCADTDWSRNLYEGVRQRQQAVPDPAATQPAAQPDFEEYKRERDKLKTQPAP